MTTELDTELGPEAYNLIQEYGKDMVLTHYTGQSYSTTGEVTKTGTDYDMKMTPPYPYNVFMVNSDTILAGDMRAFIAAYGMVVTPANGDVVTFDSQVWTVVNVSSVYSGEDVVVYELQLRR